MMRSGSPIVSSDVLASQLNNKLPIYVSVSDINENPQMANLLDDLTEKLTRTGIDNDTQAKLNHSSLSMKQARQRYMEESTLHHFVSELLLNESDSAHRNNKELTDLCRALSISELQSYTDIQSLSNEKCKTNDMSFLLDISPDHAITEAHKLVTDQHRKILYEKLQRFLHSEWSKIASFMFPDEDNTICKEDVDKLCEETHQLQKEIEAESQKLKTFRAKNDILFQQVHSQIVNYGSLLLSLVEGPRLSDESLVSLFNLYIFTQAQYSKLRCIESEILSKTYNSRTVPVLKALLNHLNDRENKVEQTLTQINHKLSAYSSLDPKFVSLLEEYTKLCRDIEFWQANKFDK